MKHYETNLEKRAEQLLELLDPDGLRREKLPRPFIVEITGSPDSGKTTTITILDAFFRRQEHNGHKYRVWKPLEGAEAVRYLPRTNHLYNTATGDYALEVLRKHSNQAEYDLILFDRCIYDAWCWMEYWYRKKDITKEEAEYLKSYFIHRSWRENIDIAFFVICDPEVAIKRDQAWSITKKAGSFTNLKTIKELHDIFLSGYNYFKQINAPVALIDTSKLNPKEVAEQILAHALGAFERRFEKNKG